MPLKTKYQPPRVVEVDVPEQFECLETATDIKVSVVNGKVRFTAYADYSVSYTEEAFFKKRDLLTTELLKDFLNEYEKAKGAM